MKYCNCNFIQNKNKGYAWAALIRTFLFFALITLSLDAVAENNYTINKTDFSSNEHPFYKEISFGEKIFFGKIDTSVKWTVTNAKENIFVNLIGEQINDYVFEKAGIYEVRFFENKKHTDECNHPQFDEKMEIKVGAIKMKFDFSKINFSEKIQKGRNCDNIIITVPVDITSQDNSITKLTSPDLTITGIGVSLIAKPLSQEVVIKNGIQLLKYQLSGTVNKETYLMFDFFDFNNQVQTYNPLQIIN